MYNTRQNHKPLPVWGQTQLLGSNWSYPINANEAIVQIASIVAGGSKSLFLYEVEASQGGSDFMQSTFSILKSLEYIREDLRIGDIDGATFTMSASSDKILVQVIRAVKKLVLIVINIDAGSYNDILCHVDINTHWYFYTTAIKELMIDVPSDMGELNQLLEVTENGIVTPTLTYSIKGGVVTINNLGLDSQFPARIFLID